MGNEILLQYSEA